IGARPRRNASARCEARRVSKASRRWTDEGTDGNLYGTTSGQNGQYGSGTIFRYTPGASAPTTLYTFTGAGDGGVPLAGLVQGADGNFYGTTCSGGAHAAGTVFSMDIDHVVTTLYAFCASSNCADGSIPLAGLVQGSDGNFSEPPLGAGIGSKLAAWALPVESTSWRGVTDQKSGVLPMPQPRPAARSFRDLQVWRKAHEFVLGVYRLTAGFPRHETYGMSQQMRRATVSVPRYRRSRRISAAWQARQSALHEHSRGLARRVSLLSHSGPRPRVWRHNQTLQHGGRNQPPTQRLRSGHSGL